MPNTTPYIKAYDLNAFQSGINGIIGGTYNLAGVVLTTGTPGSVVTPVAGSLLAARSLFSTTVPTPSTAQAGEHHRETPPAAAGSFVGSAMGVAVKTAWGIYDKSRISTGRYAITLQRVPSGLTADNVVVVATGIGSTLVTVDISLDGSNRPVLEFATYALTAGSPANVVAAESNFYFSAWVF